MGYSQLCKGRASIPYQVYLITAVTSEPARWFDDMSSAQLVIREMRALQDNGMLDSMAWVLMPDHLHWLFQLGCVGTLSDVMRRLKGRSAKAINRTLRRSGKIWQRNFYDHAVRKEEDLAAAARYIVENPLRAGLVSSLEDYPLWDTKWL